MKIRDSKVIVTGGGGLIGSHIVDRLIEDGVGQVIVVETFDRGNRDNLDEAMKSKSPQAGRRRYLRPRYDAGVASFGGQPDTLGGASHHPMCSGARTHSQGDVRGAI